MSKQTAVGIDLGTTFSAIAYMDEKGRPQTVRNQEGDISTPSVVHFSSSGLIVGREAIKAGRFEPDAIAQFAKRDMGKPNYHRAICARRLPPEVIQALVLRKLRQDASAVLGEVTRAVITVPAFFNEPRRKATMDAGALAGLEVLDIINEPTAAAIAYGVLEGFLSSKGETQRKETVLVYDLGGGTFDATLMEIDGLNYRALATDGDVFLGGIDWDRRIVDYVAEQFQKERDEDPREHPEGMQTLLMEAEEAKRSLTARDSITIHFAFGRHRTRVALSRQQFESMTEELVRRTIFTVECLLRDANKKWDDLTRILLVGGSSRMPMVQKALEQASGKTLDRSLLAEEPVALGAAIYANILDTQGDSERPKFNVKNVSSHHLGVLGVERETGMPRRKILIPRNTPLPTAA
jgi:molecular chaperone DnaK